MARDDKRDERGHEEHDPAEVPEAPHDPDELAPPPEDADTEEGEDR